MVSVLAEEFDVHPKDIDVDFNADTGVLSYTITSDNAEELTNINDQIGQDQFRSNVNELSDTIQVMSQNLFINQLYQSFFYLRYMYGYGNNLFFW